MSGRRQGDSYHAILRHTAGGGGGRICIWCKCNPLSNGTGVKRTKPKQRCLCVRVSGAGSSRSSCVGGLLLPVCCSSLSRRIRPHTSYRSIGVR